MKPLLTYMSLAFIPVMLSSLSVLLNVIGLSFGKWSSWVLIYALAMSVLFFIANPIYLVMLAKHYTIKHGVSYILSVIVNALSGLGSVLILNRRWEKGAVDFASEIMFTVELITVCAILLTGMAIVGYLKFKSKA